MVQEKLICRSKQHRSVYSAWKRPSKTKLNTAMALLWLLTVSSPEQLSQSHQSSGVGVAHLARQGWPTPPC